LQISTGALALQWYVWLCSFRYFILHLPDTRDLVEMTDIYAGQKSSPKPIL